MPPPPPAPVYYPPVPPAYVPPQPKKPNTALWLVVFAIVFILGIGISSAVAYQAGKNSVNQSPANNSSVPTQAGSTNAPPASTPTAALPSQHHFKVGDQVQTGGWLIVVTSAKTSTGDEVFQPGAGNIFVEVDLSIQNQAAQTQDMNIFDYTLRASDGTPYQAALSDLPDITGSIVAGGKDRGGIDFEVPQADKTFTLEFAPDFDVLAVWDISI